MHKSAFVITFLALLLPLTVQAQVKFSISTTETYDEKLFPEESKLLATNSTPSAGSSNSDSDRETTGTWSGAKKYSRKEFSGWALDLRRAEIIFFGSYPLFFLFCGLGYDYYYYYAVSGQDSNYKPWPMGSGTSAWTTTSNLEQLDSKTKQLLVSSAICSASLVLIDYLIGKLFP